jgi:hypothetical protein
LTTNLAVQTPKISNKPKAFREIFGVLENGTIVSHDVVKTYSMSRAIANIDNNVKSLTIFKPLIKSLTVIS